MYWKIGLLVGLAVLGFLTWAWQRYLRIICNLFLGVIVRSNPDEEQVFEGEEVSFCTADGLRIAATLARPAGLSRPPTVVFFHEFGADRRSAGTYAGWLLEAGYAVLAFDSRGHGDSKNTDDYVPRQWATDRELADGEAALAYVRSRADLDATRLILFGVSRGGVVATALASVDPDIAAVVTDGMFDTRRTLREYMERWVCVFGDISWLRSRLPHWVFAMYEKATMLVSELRLGVRFVELEEALVRRGCPLLMVHGEADSYIDVSHARTLYELASPAKELWVVPGARHNQAAMVAEEDYRKRILQFIGRFLPASVSREVHASSSES